MPTKLESAIGLPKSASNLLNDAREEASRSSDWLTESLISGAYSDIVWAKIALGKAVAE